MPSISSPFLLVLIFVSSLETVFRKGNFTSRLASFIIYRLEEIVKQMKLKIKKRAAGLLKLEGIHEGRKGILSIDAEIFEVTALLHLVEMNKLNGDTLEYEKILKEIRRALKDIVWVWLVDRQEQSQQLEQQQQQQRSQS